MTAESISPERKLRWYDYLFVNTNWFALTAIGSGTVYIGATRRVRATLVLEEAPVPA